MSRSYHKSRGYIIMQKKALHSTYSEWGEQLVQTIQT